MGWPVQGADLSGAGEAGSLASRARAWLGGKARGVLQSLQEVGLCGGF